MNCLSDCYNLNMQTSFLKMHGAGNQIVVVDRRIDNRSPPSVDTLRRMGNPETGPGFDQLMWVGPALDSEMAASYRVFNSDGSEVEQCGNGVRCVAWMLAQDDPATRNFLLESPAGPIEARVLDDNTVAVSMGVPQFDPALVPFSAATQQDMYDLDVDGSILSVSILSMGNPHCVIEVADVATADVAGIGPAVEVHQRFPARTNVGFIRIRDRGSIDLRVHERGVGETLACGTGACAAAVAGQRRGLLDEDVTVHLPGGQLVVSWRGNAEPVWLTGDAELISEGTVDL
jgi:diaminopimelate epimerase